MVIGGTHQLSCVHHDRHFAEILTNLKAHLLQETSHYAR